MKRITVKAEKCAGCRQCEMVCSFHHTGEFSPTFARVTVHKNDRDGLDYPVICHQCIECPPENVCPTNAISKSTQGWKAIDQQSCIGCGVCVNACKYDAIKLNEKAIICNLCEGDPRCISRCPTDALEYLETSESTDTPETVFNRLREQWHFE